MLFQHTPFETGFNFDQDYTAVMVLGCGVVVIHSQEMIDNAKALGYKVRSINGKTVGFAIFTRQV